MALTTCPECKGKMSSHAPACPHCGYSPFAEAYANASGRPPAKGSGCVGCLVLVVLAIAAFVVADRVLSPRGGFNDPAGRTAGPASTATAPGPTPRDPAPVTPASAELPRASEGAEPESFVPEPEAPPEASPAESLKERAERERQRTIERRRERKSGKVQRSVDR